MIMIFQKEKSGVSFPEIHIYSIEHYLFQREPQTKADKIKLALEKLKEAKVRKVK